MSGPGDRPNTRILARPDAGLNIRTSTGYKVIYLTIYQLHVRKISGRVLLCKSVNSPFNT